MSHSDSALDSAYWDRLFGRQDPWDYTSPYEQRKYQHTLAMIPPGTHESALEIGCAEGIFTEFLCRQVDSLLAVDISDVALGRARERCSGHANVGFRQHDIRNGLPPGSFDLIICSEILYYLKDGVAVRSFATEVATKLPAAGCVVLTHANMVSDDRSRTGFDFNEIGAQFIGQTFAGVPGLSFEAELQTELYRVQVFRKEEAVVTSGYRDQAEPGQPRELLLKQHAPFMHPTIKRGGCLITEAESRHLWRTERIPVLMYHRIAHEGPDELAPYRVSPENFERQLAYLQRHGYRSISLGEYDKLWFQEGARQVPGRPIVLTFDDAYADFCEEALPLLQHYGFSATVFVPVGFVGRCAEWDSEFGPPARIMDWNQLVAVSGEGIEIGAHGFAHVRPWEMSEAQFTEDTLRAKDALESRLGRRIHGYCFPYASGSERCQRVVEDAGFSFAVAGWGNIDLENRYQIPRIEVFGDWSIDDFIASLPRPVPAPAEEILNYTNLRAKRDRATYMIG